MADFKIKTDNTDKVLLEKNAAVEKALAAIALLMEKNAKMEITKKVYDLPPAPSGYKRTGRLRGSITAESDGNSAQVGTNVEYAVYVELGSKHGETHIIGRPFIKPAVENYLNEYQQIFERVLKNA